MVIEIELASRSKYTVDFDRYLSLCLLYGCDKYGFIKLNDVDSETANWITNYEKEQAARNRQSIEKIHTLIAQKRRGLEGKEDEKEFREFITELMYL